MSSSPAWLGLLRRPDPASIYRRGDPNDQRIGDLVAVDLAGYPSARVIILGYPEDEGVRRNRGRPGAAAAPAAIRRALYRLSGRVVAPGSLLDLGDTIVGPTLEDSHAAQRAVVEGVLRDGKLLIVLGGGNDVSFPDCAGLVAAAGAALALNVDAHLDVRADEPRNSGTPYRQLLEGGHLRGAQLYEVGSQPFANSPIYEGYLRERGATILPLAELRAAGVEAALGAILARSDAPAIFWGLDMDVVRSADAPGVSAPNPLGMSGEELCRVAGVAGADPRTRLVEISEVNPAHDLDDRSSRLAAAAIWHVLAARAGAPV